MITTRYTITSDKFPHSGLKAALITDLHNRQNAAIFTLESLTAEKPDFILFAGDAVNRINGKSDVALDFLEKASKIAPLFYSMGNHELASGFEEYPNEARKRGVILLDNEYTDFKGIHIGGLSAICECEAESTKEKREKFLAEFSRLCGYKLLLNHVPAYFTEFLEELDIDLIVSGHSHGGQIGLGSRGIYAPDQGFFPKYVNGIHHNRFIISRGLGQTAPLPRLFNPYEVVYISFN